MKALSVLTIFLLIGFSASANVSAPVTDSVDDACLSQPLGGVDVWPWSVAKPFPWDNIQGFWKLGDDETSYLKARVLSSTSTRKILSISLLGDGLCSKPYARGTGYIDVTEKNVVRALVSDGTFKYQLKLAKFDNRVFSVVNGCNASFIGASMQMIGKSNKSNFINTLPLDPKTAEIQNMLLRKVTIDVDTACKKIK